MARKLLVALDSTAATEKVLAYVAALARQLPGMQLQLVTVAVGLPINSQELAALEDDVPVPELHGDEDHRQDLLALQRRLNEAKNQLRQAGVPAEQLASSLLPDEGGVAADLIGAARTFGCDTLVVGRRQGAGLHHLLLGSTSRTLVDQLQDLTLWVVA